MQMIFKTSKFLFSYCVHVTSVNTVLCFFVCMCVWNNPYPPPFPPPLHICIRSLNSTGPTLPLSCVLPVCIFDSKRCASACLNNTHVFRNGAFSFANVTSCINKKGWMYFRLQRVFFLTLLSHYAVFLLNFGVRIHQGDKWNPFKKEKINQNRGGFSLTPRSEAEKLLWKRLAEDGGEWHCYCVKLWLFQFCIAHLFYYTFVFKIKYRHVPLSSVCLVSF